MTSGPRSSLRRSITRLELISALFGFAVVLVYSDHPSLRLLPSCLTLMALVVVQQGLTRAPLRWLGLGVLDLRLPWVTLLLILLCRFADPLGTPIYLTVAAAGLFEAARNPNRWRLLAIPGIPVLAILPAWIARPGWMEPVDPNTVVNVAVALPLLVTLGSLALVIAMRERRDAEAMARDQWQLRGRQHLENLILQSIDEPVLLLDDEFHIIEGSPDARKALGEQIEGRRLAELVRNPEGHDPIPTSGAMAGGSFHAVETYLAAGPLRGERWSLDIRRLPFGAAERVRWIAVLHRSAVMLRQVQVEEDRFRRLERGKLQRQDFLRLMSHELRTPLHAIKGFTELLLSQQAGPLTDAQRERLTVILGTGEMLQGLLDDVREFVTVDERPPPANTGYDLSAVVRETINLVAGTAEKASLQLTLTPPGHPLHAMGDPRMTAQALLSILNNALHFTPPGGNIRVTLRDAAGRPEVEIEDSGVGIPWTEQARVFEPLDRGREMTTRDVGTGMGLSIARRLIERQGGTISLRSRPGQGSTFTIRLRPDELGEEAAVISLEALAEEFDDLPLSTNLEEV